MSLFILLFVVISYFDYVVFVFFFGFCAIYICAGVHYNRCHSNRRFDNCNRRCRPGRRI